MPPKKATSGAKGKKGASPYNLFMKKQLAKLKEEKPNMDHKTRFKEAASSWAKSPENPKNK